MNSEESKQKKLSNVLLFHIGQTMTVEIGKSKYKTYYWGGKNGEYLIVDIPKNSTGSLSYIKDSKCVVRFVSKGNIFGFETHMIKIITDPVNLLIFAYPEKIEEITLRKSEREESFFPTKIVLSPDNGSKEINGFVVDLGPKGCKLYIESEVSINVGAELILRMSSPKKYLIQELSCCVKHIQSKGNPCILGVNFFNVSGEDLKIINEYIEIYNYINDRKKQDVKI